MTGNEDTKDKVCSWRSTSFTTFWRWGRGNIDNRTHVLESRTFWNLDGRGPTRVALWLHRRDEMGSMA